MRETTRPVGATLTWEQYCDQVGVDPHAARDASLVRALWAELRRIDAATARAFDAEPSEPAKQPNDKP